MSKIQTKKECKYFPKTTKELQELLIELVEERGNAGDFNDIWVGDIDDMFRLFNPYKLEKFNGDISRWNVSNVRDMSGMFSGCESFNQSLNNWNVSNVKDMSYMFSSCKSFNQPLDNWNVNNVENMSYMFSGCKSFNQPLDKWDVSKVKDMSNMFKGCDKFLKDKIKSLCIWKKYNNILENISTTDMFGRGKDWEWFEENIDCFNISKKLKVKVKLKKDKNLKDLMF